MSDLILTLADVAEILKTSNAQVYALLRRGDLRGFQIGDRGQWRVQAVELEAYIKRMSDAAAAQPARYRAADSAAPES